MLITGLEDYKARGTQATPYFTVTYYTEFTESKDLVLIRGDIVFTSKLTDSEATWLLDTAQSFYLNDVRYKLVERFNKETREFEFKDVLQTLEMPILWFKSPIFCRKLSSMLQPGRILRNYTTFGESDMRVLTFLKSPSNHDHSEISNSRHIVLYVSVQHNDCITLA